MASLAEEVRFQPGDTIFREREPADKFYFLNGGEARLEYQTEGIQVTVEKVHAGEEIGWSAMMDFGVRHFTAKAETEVYAIALSGPQLRQVCERNPAFGFVLMKHLLFLAAERLDATRIQLVRAIHR